MRLRELVRRHVRPPRGGLELARAVVRGLSATELASLRYELIVDALPPVWRITLAVAVALENKGGPLPWHVREAAGSLDPCEADLLLADLLACNVPRSKLLAILEQLVVDVPEPNTISRSAANGLRGLGIDGETYVQRANREEGPRRVRLLRLGVAVWPGNRHAALSLGHEMATLGNHRDAVTWFRLAINLRSDDPAPHLGLGVSLVRLGEHRDAISAFSYALAHASAARNKYQALIWRARARVASGELDDADLDLDAAEIEDVDEFGHEVESIRRRVTEARDARRPPPQMPDRIYCTRSTGDESNGTTTSNSNNTDNDSFSPASLLSYPTTKLDDVIGEQLCERIHSEVILPWRNGALARKLGLRPASLLLHGAFGTGKTFVVDAICGELSIPLLKIESSTCGSMYVFRVEGRLHMIGDFVRSLHGGCCVLIDEAESIVPAFGSDNSGHVARVGLSVITLVSKLRTLEKVLVVACTNRTRAVNAALLRGGRVDTHIEMPCPTRVEREQLFARYARGIDAKALKLDRLARLDYSQAEVQSLAETLARRVLRESAAAGHEVAPTQRDLDAVIDQNPPRDLLHFDEDEKVFNRNRETAACGFRRTS